MAATDDERKLLRSASLVRAATPDEVEGWLAASNSHMSDKSKTAFRGMSAENQYRIISEGPLTAANDSTEILYTRIQRFMDMESQLKKLASARDEDRQREKDSKPKERKASDLATAIGKALVSETSEFKEVPLEERRCAPAAAPEVEAAPLVGNAKGIGGVIEATKRKFGMAPGQRARVVAETRELWKLQDELTVPKIQVNQNWKWVIEVSPEEASKKQAAEEEKRRKEEEKKKKKEAEEEAKKQKKAEEEAEKEEKKKGEKERKAASRSSSSRKPRDAERKSGKAGRRKRSPSDESESPRRGGKRRRSPSRRRSRSESRPKERRGRGRSEDSRGSEDSRSRSRGRRRR